MIYGAGIHILSPADVIKFRFSSTCTSHIRGRFYELSREVVDAARAMCWVIITRRHEYK